MKHIRNIAVFGGLTIATLGGLFVTSQRVTSTDSPVGNPRAELIGELQDALKDPNLSSEARSLLDAKLESQQVDEAARLAAPKIDKSTILPPPKAEPTVYVRFEPALVSLGNPWANSLQYRGNNEWNGYVDDHPAAVVAGNLFKEPEQGVLNVRIWWLGDVPGRIYEVRIPRPTGELTLVAFDDTTVTASGADGSRWRLNVKSGELTETK